MRLPHPKSSRSAVLRPIPESGRVRRPGPTATHEGIDVDPEGVRARYSGHDGDAQQVAQEATLVPAQRHRARWASSRTTGGYEVPRLRFRAEIEGRHRRFSSLPAVASKIAPVALAHQPSAKVPDHPPVPVPGFAPLRGGHDDRAPSAHRRPLHSTAPAAPGSLDSCCMTCAFRATVRDGLLDGTRCYSRRARRGRPRQARRRGLPSFRALSGSVHEDPHRDLQGVGLPVRRSGGGSEETARHQPRRPRRHRSRHSGRPNGRVHDAEQVIRDPGSRPRIDHGSYDSHSP